MGNGLFLYCIILLYYVLYIYFSIALCFFRLINILGAFPVKLNRYQELTRPDCVPMVGLEKCESEPLYIPTEPFNLYLKAYLVGMFHL